MYVQPVLFCRLPFMATSYGKCSADMAWMLSIFLGFPPWPPEFVPIARSGHLLSADKVFGIKEVRFISGGRLARQVVG